jgi:site-specific recombinase XerD
MLTCCAMLPATPWRAVESIQGRKAFMGHRSIANTVVYTAVADKRIRNIWGK